MSLPDATLTGFSVAFGCGLLIGIERERVKGIGPQRRFVGVRSFVLVSLLAALAQTLDHALVVVGAVLVLVLSAIAHWRRRSDDPGITSELALFISYLLGVCALSHPALAAGTAVVVATMLNLRAPLHHFARVTIKTEELRDVLTLAGAALIVWPLLPDGANPWLLGANPRRMWGLVLAIMSLQGVAHIALRLTGPALGLALTGVASGFVSSTATTAAMGQRFRTDPTLLGAYVAAALLSNIATFLMLAVVVLTIAPDQMALLAPSFGCGLLATVLVSAAGLRAAHDTPRHAPPARGHAFSVPQALLFSLILSSATAIVTYAHAYLGSTAATVGAVLAGLVDSHAALGSVLALSASGVLAPSAVLGTALLVLTANTGSKLLAAALGGGRPFFVRTAGGLLVILAAAWLPYWWQA